MLVFFNTEQEYPCATHITVNYVHSLERFSELILTAQQLPECSCRVQLCAAVALEHCSAAEHSQRAKGFPGEILTTTLKPIR